MEKLIQMSDVSVNQKSRVDLQQIKGGLKEEQVKNNKAQQSIFNALDSDNNGVLDEGEIEKFKSVLDKNNDNSVSKKELKKFLKELKLKDVDRKELLEFLQNYDLNIENVAGTKIIDNHGNKSVQVDYKDGSTEVINHDKSSQITQTDENGTSTTRYMDADKNLLKEKTVTKDGETTETQYAPDGKTPVSSVVQSKDGKIATITYQDGKPAAKQVKHGSVVENYSYDENGNAVLNSKVENEGIPAKEKRTEYQYNQDGSVTETITEHGKTTQRLSKNGVTIAENINENGKTKTRTYYEKGYEEHSTDENGNPTVDVYSLEGKRLAQQKTIDGQTYSVLYDGEGNTKVIVQNGESLSAIAKKFDCSVDDLKELNQEALNGKNYFQVGAEIKVPGEFEADAPQLQGRKTAEEAEVEYAQQQAEKAAKEAQYKAMGLKNHNGQGTKITGEYKGGQQEEFTVIGEAGNGRHLAEGKDGKIVTISHDGKILKEEYVQLTNLYADGEKIKGKVKVKNKDGSTSTETRNYVEIKDANLPHGRKAVIDEKGKVWVMSHDGVILDENYLARSNYSDAIRSDKTTAQNATVDMLTQQLDSAQAAFDAQMKEDGWAADVADGISNIWGIFQENGNQAWRVRKDLAQYRKDMEELKEAAKQGDSQFRAKFKDMFGVEYNQNAIADYMQNPSAENYKKAFGTKNDIGTRVANYNESQQLGGEVVKGAATVAAGIAIGVATGGTGLVALGAAAAATTASSVAINASDRLSSDVGLKEGEMGQIVENALWDGAAVAVGGVVGKAAMATVKGATTTAGLARGALSATGDVAMGAAQEYAQTGKVTIEGTALNAALGTVGMAAESGALQRAGQKIKGAFHKNSTPANANPSVVDARIDYSSEKITRPEQTPELTPEVQAQVSDLKGQLGGKFDKIAAQAKNDGLKNINIEVNDLKAKLEYINDAEILEYINKMDLDPLNGDLAEAIELVDAVNTFNGHYTSFKMAGKYGSLPWHNIKNLPDSQKAEFMKFIKENDPDLYNAISSGKNVKISSDKMEKLWTAHQKEVFAKDAEILEQTQNMAEYMKKYKNSPMSNHLYDMYLNRMKAAGMPDAVIAKCRDLNTRYGTKIVLGSDAKEAGKVLNDIDSELNLWTAASEGQAKMPPVIDFNNFNREWFDKSSAYGQSSAAAYSEVANGALAFSKTTKHTVRHALRHEMTHTNDLRTINVSQDVIDRIMPKTKKIVNGKEVYVPDMKNALYVDEFRNAGISRSFISYAYNSPAEFIAVAAEGDMTKYSPAFKKLLVDMGMPEWMFKMSDPSFTASVKSAGINKPAGQNPEVRAAANETPASHQANAAENLHNGAGTSILTDNDMKMIVRYSESNGIDPDVSREMFDEITNRIRNGELPSKEMMQSVTQKFAQKYDIDAGDLKNTAMDAMEDMDDWEEMPKLFKRSQNSIKGSSYEETAADFRSSKNLYSESHLNAMDDMIANIEAKVINGEIPSSEMLQAAAQEAAQKYGISNIDDLIDTTKDKMGSTSLKRMTGMFNKPLDKNRKAIDDGYSTYSRDFADLRKSKGLPEKTDAQIKQEEAAQAAEVKAKQDAEEAKNREIAQQNAQRQAVLDKYADKYNEVVTCDEFRNPDSPVKLINLMENYDLKMNYKNFDSTKLYSAIYQAGITNDADMDIAFDMIKKRFHSDIISEEARIKTLSGKYKLNPESIEHSDNVINKIKQMADNGEKISAEDIDLLIETNAPDMRALDNIKQRIYDEPELQDILNDNLHLDVYSNPKYKGFEHEIPTAMEIFDKIMADVKNGEPLTLELINKHYNEIDSALRQKGGYVSTDTLWVLQDAIRSHKTLGPMSADFIDDFVKGGFDT